MKPLSICITSCNRFKYLKALLLSLDDIKGENVEFNVVDMGSTESGLKEYLESLEHVNFFQFNKERDWINDEYIARNKLLEMSNHDTIMFLQDDSQFIANKEALSQAIDDLWTMEDCYCLEIYGVRRVTLRDTVDMTPVAVNDRKYWRRKDGHFLTTGIYKRELFQEIGNYPTAWPTEKSYWGRSEDWYDKAVKNHRPHGQTYRTHVPLALSIWNDPRGGYAFIREDKRWGHYLDPVDESGLYYAKSSGPIVSSNLFKRDDTGPVSFMEIAEPLGWEIAKDEFGDQKKYPQQKIMEEGPCEKL